MQILCYFGQFLKILRGKQDYNVGFLTVRPIEMYLHHVYLRLLEVFVRDHVGTHDT